MRARFVSSEVTDVVAFQGVSSLREGEEYVVLEIFVPHGRNPLFRVEFIEGENSGLFDSRVFEVTSSKLPSAWRYCHFASGSFAFRPEAWSRPGFWEAYSERTPWAIEIYETEKRKLLASS